MKFEEARTKIIWSYIYFPHIVSKSIARLYSFGECEAGLINLLDFTLTAYVNVEIGAKLGK